MISEVIRNSQLMAAYPQMGGELSGIDPVAQTSGPRYTRRRPYSSELGMADEATESSAHWIYNQTVKMFAAGATPEFEAEDELEKYWGRAWGIDNDVGRMRAVLVHRPGDELRVVDPKKR